MMERLNIIGRKQRGDLITHTEVNEVTGKIDELVDGHNAHETSMTTLTNTLATHRTILNSNSEVLARHEEQLSDLPDMLEEVMSGASQVKFVSPQEYDALGVYGERTLYMIMDDGVLYFVYLGEQLLARRGETSEAKSNVFPLTFPVVF